MTRPISRRTLLSAALAVGGGVYIHQRGLRYPTLSLEPRGLANAFAHNNSQWQLSDCFQTAHPTLTLRAFAPEPKISISGKSNHSVEFRLNNVAPDCELRSNLESVKETISGIDRFITIPANDLAEITLEWFFPYTDHYTFASIGDTGGADELAWCLDRAHQLGAKFLLHLGDFYYQAGDYETAIEHFYTARIPCYVAIGNHDFHDGGLLHHQFTDFIGPFNHAFTLGATRFVNLDTAANFLPRSSGKRGTLVKELLSNDAQPTTVAFTHKPLHDPTGQSSHDIGHEGERDWLVKTLRALNAPTLLSGHIHIFDRSEFAGIDNIIIGQGLGHQDLLTSDIGYSKMAVGTVNANVTVDYHFGP